jgi:hypothetical protein
MSKEIYIEYIVSELEKGNVSFERVFELIVTKFNLSRPTFSKYWKLANEAYKVKRDVINEAKLSETIQIEKEVVKTIISNKLERLEIYHNQIINCIKELTHGFTEEMKNGELFSRPLTISEKALLRKTIKDLQSEISKIEGDYSPTKIETDASIIFNINERD